MSKTCPSRDVLLWYLHGKTSVAETETVESHIGVCTSCQTLLEVLSEEPDSLMQRIAGVARTRMVVGGPGLEPDWDEMNYEEKILQDRSSGHPFSDEKSSTMIRDYRILECIGRGGMGSVYRALHVRLDKQVALKILKSERMGSPEAISRFAREMKVLAQLEHGNIVGALDAGEQDGLPYFVMEFVSGINLQQLVRRVGPLPVQDACHIACLAASALQYAHDQKVIHRDVKPSNLMLTPDGNVKLLDLGLAQILEMDGMDVLSRTDQVLGTLAYMSPEQLSGSHQVTPQSDIFSLGVTLHELLTGQRPSGRLGLPPQATDIQSHRPDVDLSLIALVADMLAVAPNKRPISMSEVESRLRAIALPANLSNLVAAYYRWESRGIPVLAPGFARADTEASAALSTDSQSTPKATSSVIPTDAIPKFPLWKHASFMQKGQTLALVGCVAVIGWMATAVWPPSGQGSPETGSSLKLGEPETPPEVTSHVQVSGESDLALQLLERGEVGLEDTRTGKVIELTNGNVELPPGTYTLRYDTPIGFQADGKFIEIAPASTQTLRIEAQLTKVFQHPDLPDVGASATYYGEIWHAGWGDRREQMSYTLDLEVLKEENEPGSPAAKWLLVEITDQDHGYAETAYIKVDVKHWENRKQLEIYEGWIEARTASGKSLVVPFDRKHDLLSECNYFELPSRRLSAQDAIALFFAVEEQMPIAAVDIRRARLELSKQEQRNEWLGPVKAARGTTICYIASSRTKDQDDSVPGYRLARRDCDDSCPFGIVEIQVNIPILDATCTMKNASASKPDAERSEIDGERIARKLKELKLDAETSKAGMRKPSVPLAIRNEQDERPEYVKWFAEVAFLWSSQSRPSLPPITGPKLELERELEREPDSGARTIRFDLAPLPTGPAFVTWTGNISHSPQRSETVIATARTLMTEVIDGREYLWIEVTSTSVMDGRQDYWEGARLLVDAATYEETDNFNIKGGWIAYGKRDNVFRISESLDLDSLLDVRLQLQEQPQIDRVNVIDVLSMLFHAKLNPPTPITRLRAKISGFLAGMDRTSIPVTRQLRIGKTVGECWESPIKLAGSNYKFFRSPQVPFGFASVNLTFDGITINLEVDSKADSQPSNFSMSVFGTPAELSVLHNRNKARLPTDPNWHVWTWHDGETMYKARAEFGGTIQQRTGRDVLLRNQQGSEICVPEQSLAENDLKFMRQGRLWTSFSDNQQRVLLEDKVSSLRFQLMDGSELTFQGVVSKVADQRWLDALRAAIKRKANSTNSKEHWQAFADYVR